jgi:hypothetical protein
MLRILACVPLLLAYAWPIGTAVARAYTSADLRPPHG